MTSEKRTALNALLPDAKQMLFPFSQPLPGRLKTCWAKATASSTKHPRPLRKEPDQRRSLTLSYLVSTQNDTPPSPAGQLNPSQQSWSERQIIVGFRHRCLTFTTRLFSSSI